MSVGIIVMTKRGIGLAADSALTLSAPRRISRILSTANKVHQLHEEAPVGIIHAGSSEIMQFPWETAFAFFRKENTTRFPTLIEYGRAFLNFLKSKVHLCNEQQQLLFAGEIISESIDDLANRVWKDVRRRRLINGEFLEEPERQVVRDTIELQRVDSRQWEKQPGLPHDYDVTFKANYEKIFKTLHQQKCWRYAERIFSAKEFEQLDDPVWEIILNRFKACPDPSRNKGASQLIIVGYGDTEEFPSFVEYRIEGMANGHLMQVEKHPVAVDFDNPARVKVIGLDDVVRHFMYGVDVKLLDRVLQAWASEVYPVVASEILDEIKNLDDTERQQLKERFGTPTPEVVAKVARVLVKHSQKEYTERQMFPTLRYLSTGDLTMVAAKLADMTSFRKQISSERPTVRGPIDVALISKNDGFQWVQRKSLSPSEYEPFVM